MSFPGNPQYLYSPDLQLLMVKFLWGTLRAMEKRRRKAAKFPLLPLFLIGCSTVVSLNSLSETSDAVHQGWLCLFPASREAVATHHLASLACVPCLASRFLTLTVPATHLLNTAFNTQFLPWALFPKEPGLRHCSRALSTLVGAKGLTFHQVYKVSYLEATINCHHIPSVTQGYLGQ